MEKQSNSKGGKITLIQATLTNLPTYYLSIYRMPTKVTENLDKLIRSFLWEGNKDGPGLHHVKWENLLNPMKEGGLGFYSLKDRNRTLLTKWIRRYQSEKSALWRKVIDAKYGGTPLNNPGSISLRADRGPWKTIMKHCHLIHDRLYYILGNGANISFWKNTWLGIAPLNQTYPLLFNLSQNKEGAIKDFWGAELGFWNLRLRRNQRDTVIEEFGALIQCLSTVSLSQNTDRGYWKLELNGTFSNKSLLQDIAPGQ